MNRNKITDPEAPTSITAERAEDAEGTEGKKADPWIEPRSRVQKPPTSFTAERAENAERKVGSMRLQKQAMDPTVRDKRD